MQRERGELTQRAFNDYHRVAKEVARYFGKGRLLESRRAPEFERYRDSLPDTWGPTTTNNHLRLVRILFKYANDVEATERGIRYQIGLKGVPKATVRKHEAKKPAKEFTAAEIHALLAKAGVPMRAFILLGINAAYGTMDIARLKTADIDRKGVGHYSLRHVFETVAGESRDQVATSYVMGHHDPSMSAVYREGIDPKRVKAVCQHVRKWFLAGKPKKNRREQPVATVRTRSCHLPRRR